MVASTRYAIINQNVLISMSMLGYLVIVPNTMQANLKGSTERLLSVRALLMYK